MQIIPAIDISKGQCVRLKQGDMSEKTVFSNQPVNVARRWQEMGAELLHIVDLDGAVDGETANMDAIENIIDTVDIPVELGGGIRNRDDVQRVLDMGVKWAIMGSTALADRAELEKCIQQFPEAITVAIDARDGKVAVEGWTETTDVDAIELAQQVQVPGVQRVIFTDIASDGMLAGPNQQSIRQMTEAVSVDLIASGGITTLDDIRSLKMLEPFGVVGCIIGRALYSGTIDIGEAIEIATGHV